MVREISIYKSYDLPKIECKQKKSVKSFAQNKQQDAFVRVPVPTLLAYMNNINKLNKSKSSLSVTFSVPISSLKIKYRDVAKSNIQNLNTRAGQKGQVLNWIEKLPTEQISRLDEIYSLASQGKTNGSKKLGIIGIGGSKHTIENLLSLNGYLDNVVFLSAVDPASMDKFVERLGDVKDVTIMVASKSGTTLEPSTGYEYVKNALVEKFKNEYLQNGYCEQDAIRMANSEASKHFICVTDKDASKSKLRQIANEKGYACGVIHDDCGGRFGAFDDHTLVALAWCGMKKDDMKEMLESSLNAQKKFLNDDLDNNIAMQRSIFNTECILNGKSNQHDYYFGDFFEGTKLWNTQMKKESHKSLYKVSADLIGPEFLHNSTESDLDAGNKTSFYTFNKLANDKSEKYKSYNALIEGSYKSYSERHPVSTIELADLSPKSIGEFIELKHFEALYTGMLLRNLNSGKGFVQPDVLPEVVQPSVGIYKKEVQKILNS